MNTRAILVLPPSLGPLLHIAPDGSFRGQRTELPAGGAIGKGGTKYRAYCEDAHHRLQDRSGEDALTNTQAILVPLTRLSPPLFIAPDGSFRGRCT